MNIVLGIVWVAMYLAIGYGAYWLESSIYDKLLTRIAQKGPLEAFKEYVRLTSWQPRKYNLWVCYLVFAMAISIILIWPIGAIVYPAYLWYSYYKILKKYGESH